MCNMQSHRRKAQLTISKPMARQNHKQYIFHDIAEGCQCTSHSMGLEASFCIAVIVNELQNQHPCDLVMIVNWYRGHHVDQVSASDPLTTCCINKCSNE